MNTLLDWLFGFESGSFGSPDSGLGFSTPMPVWIWLGLFVVIGLLVWLSYRGLGGLARTRFFLGMIRWALITLMLVLALGPRIEQRRTHVEPDRVLILLDHSGSMNLTEITSDGSLATRAELLKTLLTANAGVFEQLAQDSTLDVYQFSNTPTNIDDPLAFDPETIADSQSTFLGNSIQTAITNAGTSPVSGIVVFSDGQSHDEPAPELLESLLRSDIPIISIPIGSGDPVHDISIRQIESPQTVFAKDRVPVRVLVDVNGYNMGSEVVIELVDQSTGQVLSSTTKAVENGSGIDADLSYSFSEPGVKRLLVRLTSGGKHRDLVPDNNEQSIELRVISEPMRVLYIDGHPRWEYRYLKNILMRESTINATTMLLASDRRFIEEGQPINGPIPDSLDGWEPFDVVILGDIRPELFSDAQLTSLKAHIESRGCGLLWIAGEGATPKAWSNSQLTSLLPMQRGKSDSMSNSASNFTPVVMSMTPLADRAGILATDRQPTRVDDSQAGWTILRWTHSVGLDELKPGVATLALAHTTPIDRQPARALVTTMRYGRGQIGYVGTDEIWRWRYGRGEDLPERFWLPMIRTLARGTIARRAAPAALNISPTRIVPSMTIRATLELFDSAIIEALPRTIQAKIQSLSSPQLGSPLTLTGAGSRRAATWAPNEPGMYTISITHPIIGVEPITQTFRVHAAWEESINPNTDHHALELLSNHTNGQTLAGSELWKLPSILPNRTRTTTLPPLTTPLWDRPVVLILLILLLSIEWIGRRWLRLA